MAPIQGFSVRHAEGAPFEPGLRPDFEYRDLGVRDVTGGRYVAHVIRAIPGKESRPVRHHHEVELQIVYVIRGWITFRYDGVGEVKLVAGSCVHQPAGLPHVEVGHSEDLEMVEIAAPADFRTVND